MGSESRTNRGGCALGEAAVAPCAPRPVASWERLEAVPADSQKALLALGSPTLASQPLAS